MRAYRDGTLAVSAANNVVTGTGTQFVANVSIGDIILLQNGVALEIIEVTDDTTLKVDTVSAAAASGLEYVALKFVTPLQYRNLSMKIEQFLTDRQVNLTEFAAWTTGTATGGPNGDGQYPLTDRFGNTILADSPTKMMSVAGSPNVKALAAAIAAANKGIYFTTSTAIGTYDLSPAGRSFLAALDKAAQRTELGLGTASVLDANAFAQTFLNASSVAQQRTALALGAVATDSVVPIARGGTGATTQAGAQTTLGLVPQSASADASEGALLVQRGNGGSWGLGSSAATDSSTANTDIRTYANTRFFANAAQHNPALENKTELQFSSGLFISGGPSIQSSMVIGYGASARMGFLSKLNGSTWNPVRVLWDDNSLVLTNSPLDFTVGRSTIVGFAGWGGSAPSIDPSTTGVTDQQSSLLYSIAGNGSPFPTSTPIINVRGTRSMAWAARGSRSWVYTYGETPVLMEHWTDKNLNLSNLPDLTINGGLSPLSINTSQPSGLTLTRLNATGNNSIKFVTTSAGGYERHLGFAVGGVLKVNSGPDLTDVNAETVWTSASLPKQTSVTDTTVNSVLTTLGNIGPFGLGGYPVQRRSLGQMNLDRGNEFFDNNLSTADNPFGGPGCGIHMTYPATARWAQLFFKTVGVSGVSIHARAALGGSPVAPVELWHTGNLTPNKLGSYTLATLPNAAANVCLMAWCSNLTGGPRVVVSDGVNWRRVFDNSIAN